METPPKDLRRKASRRKDLWVVVRSTDWVKQNSAAVSRPIAGDLAAVYGTWEPDDERFAPLSSEVQKALGLDLPHLHVAAVRHVIAALGPIERDGAAGAWLLNEPAGLEETLLFVPAIWDWVSSWLDGPAVAALPSRDVLLVTGANDPDGIERLLEAARAVFDDAEEPISLHPIRRDGRVWRDWQ